MTGVQTCALPISNGVYADSARLAALVDGVASPAVAVLWDVHHPWRYFGEAPELTWQNLGRHIRYIHVKDSVCIQDKVSYRMLGHGDLPLDRMLGLLADNGYDGYVSLEWVKRWSHDLEDAAIVFPHFANYMQQFLRERGRTPAVSGPTAVPPAAVSMEAAKVSGQRLFEKFAMVDYTIGELLEKVAAEFPDQPAIRYTTLDYSRSYSEFLRDIDQVEIGRAHV